jgi:hypothetical protein
VPLNSYHLTDIEGVYISVSEEKKIFRMSTLVPT